MYDAHEVAGASRAVLISESLAEYKFQDRGPIGQRLHIGPRNEPWYTIVGAQRSDVLALISRQGVSLIVSGVGIGLCGAWATTRLLRRLLFGISANDPLVSVP